MKPGFLTEQGRSPTEVRKPGHAPAPASLGSATSNPEQTWVSCLNAANVIISDDAELIEKNGIINAACENRNLGGRGVSVDQPSIIDDLSIKSGFYGCAALGMARTRIPSVNRQTLCEC